MSLIVNLSIFYLTFPYIFYVITKKSDISSSIITINQSTSFISYLG